MGTFDDIVDRWYRLPRHYDGKPVDGSLTAEVFQRWLTSTKERAWFEACHELYLASDSSLPHEALEEIFDWLPLFQQNMAQAHLECARLCHCVQSETLSTKLDLIARKRNLPAPLLRELVNEIRTGQPRSGVDHAVSVAVPLVSDVEKTVVLGRFQLEIFTEDNAAGGELFLAPAHALRLELQDDFQSIFPVAVTVVKNALESRTSTPDVRVSFDLCDTSLDPVVLSLHGRSGGAALGIGLAKSWLVDQGYPALRNLDFSSTAISAELDTNGDLKAVADIHIKALLTRESEAHEVNVLVVADQQGFPQGTEGSDGSHFLLPSPDLIPTDLATGKLLRTPNSLLVVRAANLFDAIDKLQQLQANTLIEVLEKPHFIAAYLVGGNRAFAIALLLLTTACWYLLRDYWFLLVPLVLLTLGILFVRYQLQKIKRGAKFCLLPRNTAYSPATWLQMAATLEVDPLTRFTNLTWFKHLLTRTSRPRLNLRMLPRIWSRHQRFWIHSLGVMAPLVVLCTPLQHCLTEDLFFGKANIRSGESRRGDGNNTKYAPVDSQCDSDRCVMETMIGSYGLLRLQVQPKPRTRRFLRVSNHSPFSYVKLDDNGPRQDVIVVPIVNNEARFYYGISENTPWEIMLEVEVLSYCGRVLRKGRLIGNRAPPGK